MTAERIRLLLEGVVFALTVALAWVMVTEGIGSTGFTILLSIAIPGNLVMAILALLALRAPRP